MVEAWYMGDSKEDQCLPHRKSPNEPATLEALKDIGVLYFKVPLANYADALEGFAKERNYKNRDEITISRTKLPNYEEKLKMFFEEHIHEDEEIRFVAEGTGYFDVRDKADRWIRIAVIPGDLLILPAGIYHRFTLDVNNYLKAVRLFKEEPKWTPINRGEETEANPFRNAYVSSLSQ